MRQKVGIVGFRGYSGAELVRILARHTQLEPVLMEHRKDVEDHSVHRDGLACIPCTPEAVLAAGLAGVFLATPADVSMELAIFALWIFMIVKTSQEQVVSLPIIGELAEKSLAE